MNFAQFLLILKARRVIVLIVFGLTVLTTLVVSLVLPKTYKAVATVVLNSKGTDPVTGMSLPAVLMPGYMSTQIEVITSRNVALKVVDRLGMANNKETKERFDSDTKGVGDFKVWLADRLLDKTEAKPSPQSSVIEITFKGADPEFAALVANAFAEAYQQTDIQLKDQPAQKAAEFLGEQAKSLRDNLEQAQAKLAQYQKEKGLTNVSGNLDVESARLNELSSQLVMAQNETFNATSRQERAAGNGETSPDVEANPMVQSLKIDISRAESKFSELSQRLGPSHPQYQQALAELTKLKSQLQEEKRKASTTIGGTASIHKQREGEIRAALAKQKERVLELNLTRDQLSVLSRDVENAQRALDMASNRFTQTKLEGSANQTDIAILNPATVPTSAASPRIFLNALIAAFVGTLFGIGSGIVAEMFDRRVRSREDIGELLNMPVLVLIDSRPSRTLFRRPKTFSAKAI